MWRVAQHGTTSQCLPHCHIFYRDRECSYPDVWYNPSIKKGVNVVWYLVGFYWVAGGLSPYGTYRECWSFYEVDPYNELIYASVW